MALIIQWIMQNLDGDSAILECEASLVASGSYRHHGIASLVCTCSLNANGEVTPSGLIFSTCYTFSFYIGDITPFGRIIEAFSDCDEAFYVTDKGITVSQADLLAFGDFQGEPCDPAKLQAIPIDTPPSPIVLQVGDDAAPAESLESLSREIEEQIDRLPDGTDTPVPSQTIQLAVERSCETVIDELAALLVKKQALESEPTTGDQPGTTTVQLSDTKCASATNEAALLREKMRRLAAEAIPPTPPATKVYLDR